MTGSGVAGSAAIPGSSAGPSLNGREVVVRGVMPPGFNFPDPSVELWLPLNVVRGVGYATPNGRWARLFAAYGRVRPDVTLEQAQGEMKSIAAQLARENPGPNAELGVLVTTLKSSVLGSTGRTLWIMFGAAGFVLLIACANVSNLGLVRLLTRSREIAIRLAHGATRGALARQFLSESLVLALLGSVMGTALAFAAVRRWWQPGRRRSRGSARSG